MRESQQHEQLLDDDTVEMQQHQLIDNDNDSEGIDSATPTSSTNSYHKLPSLDSIRMFVNDVSSVHAHCLPLSIL